MDEDRSNTTTAGATTGPAGADCGAGRGPLEPDVAPATDSASGEHETRAHVVTVYRTAAGWRVGGEELPDLVSAMVFADLLANDLPSSARPTTDGGALGTGDAETARLKVTIAQLEHALAHRVRVEQAIGVLTERHRLPPRQSFELLRTAARSRGRRVQELADEVLANVTNPLLPVAEELARPQAARRGRSRSRA
jgi:hypothetical protein